MDNNQNSPICRVYIQPSDLKGKSFEDLSEQYRSDNVTGLITRLDLLDGTVFILLSPLNSAFARRASDRSLANHGYHAPFDWGNDLELSRAYTQELRKAGIRKSAPQSRLFGSGGVGSCKITFSYR